MSDVNKQYCGVRLEGWADVVVPAISKEAIRFNMLKVTAGTNVPQGGDSECETLIECLDFASTTLKAMMAVNKLS